MYKQRNFGQWSLIVAICMVCLAAATYFPNRAMSQTTNLGPFDTALSNVTSGSNQIIGQNPSRKALSICNPSSHIMWVAPAPIVAAAAGAGSVGIPAASSGTTTCFNTPTNITGGLGAAWNGLDATSGGNLTIFEYSN